MIRSFTGTWMLSNEKLRKADIEITVFNIDKYHLTDEAVENAKEVHYTGLTQWDIIEGGAEAEKIEAETDDNSADPNHEYLVLHFEDGNTATFRNSFVDMAIRRS